MTKLNPAVAFISIAMLICIAHTSSARPNGFPSRFSKTTEGCGGCHGNENPYPEVGVRLDTVGNPTTVEAGKRTLFTIVVSHATQKVAGINVAVATQPEGMELAGIIDAAGAMNLRVTENQIVHRSPRKLQDTVSFTVGWTAPMEPGTYYLEAVSMAGNGDGIDGEDDRWNWLEPVAITVTPATTVNEPNEGFQEIIESGAVGLIPKTYLPVQGQYTVTVLSIDGAVVFRKQYDNGQLASPFQSLLPAGVYVCMITDNRGRSRSVRLLL